MERWRRGAWSVKGAFRVDAHRGNWGAKMFSSLVNLLTNIRKGLKYLVETNTVP